MRRTFVDFEKAQDYRNLCDKSKDIFDTMPRVVEVDKDRPKYEVLEKYHDKILR